MTENACNGDETCRAGHCLQGLAPSFSDGNPCTSDTCDPTTGVLHEPTPAGVPCSDGNKCNGAETCDGAGTCQDGAAPELDDGNPCSVDTCDPIEGVLHVPAAQGTSCADSDPCNGEETCDGNGVCAAGQAPQLDDGNPCTIDTCAAGTGVIHTPSASGSSCSDGDVCNGEEVCDGAGLCLPGTSLTLDDGNECTQDFCDATSGVMHVPMPAGAWCSNNNPCDGLELCDDNGTCVAGEPLATDDGNACTDDACDPVLGVTHTPVAADSPCEDGNLCNGAETCDGAGNLCPGHSRGH